MNKLLLKTIAVLTGAYLSLLLFAVFASDQLIFLPHRASYSLSEDIIYVSSPHATKPGEHHLIAAHYLENPEATHTIIYSHGNAVDIGQLTRLQQRFYDHGYSSIIYDYSGYGISEGQASEQQTYNDVTAVYDHFVGSIAAEQIIAYGHSLGSAIATHLASQRRVAALILESPFTSAFRVKTIFPILPFEKFDTLALIPDIDVPVMITHDREDPVIPSWHSEVLYQAANSPKKVLWLDGFGHSGITHSTAFWSTLRLFLNNAIG